MLPRTAINLTTWVQQFSARNVTRTSAATTIDQASGMVVQNKFAAGMPSPYGEGLYLVVDNSDTVSHTLTVRAGDTTFAGAHALGDDTSLVVPANAERVFGPVNLARHAQNAAGDINIDFDSGAAGTITAELRKV